MSVYFLYGQEEYNIDLELEKFKKQYLDKNFSTLNLRYFDAPKYSELSNILRTTGTMFGNILNIIDAWKYFTKDKKDKITFDEDELKGLTQDLQNTSDNVHTIFVLKLPRDEKKSINYTSEKLYKLLTKYAQCKEFKQYKSFDKELPMWIIKQAKSKDLIMSSDCAAYMIEKSGVNLVLLNSQLDKLKLCIYPQTKVTKEYITQFLTITEDIYKIADFIVAKRKDLAVLEFKKICEKQHYLEVLSLLQSTFSSWIEIKADIETMSLAEIAQKMHRHEYVIKITLQKLNNTSLAQLARIKKNLIKAEEAIKINFSTAGELEVEKALLSDF